MERAVKATKPAASLQHSKAKKPRWRLNLAGKLVMSSEVEMPTTGTLMVDECLLRLRQLTDRLTARPDAATSHIVLADMERLFVHDMYLRRFCREGATAIFAHELRRIALETVRLVDRWPKLPAAPILEVLRFVLDQQVQFDLRESEDLVAGLLTYSLHHPDESISNSTLFSHINALIYQVISRLGHEVDCSLFPAFVEVYSRIAGLDCSEAAVTLLSLIGNRHSQYDQQYSIHQRNCEIFESLPWVATVFPELCRNVWESIKHLTSQGRYQQTEREQFVAKLLPKSLELLDNMGFVFASKLFQEAYWMFNLEGVLRLLVRLGVAEVDHALEYVQLMTNNDYFPRSAIELLEEFALVPQRFEQVMTNELDELGQYLGMLEEVDCRDCKQLAHFFEKLRIKNQGFVGLLVEKIFDLKWELLRVLAAMLEREDFREIQMYLMKNGLIAFLLEELFKQSIALPFLGPAYRTLGLFLRNNTVGLSYVQWMRSRLERQLDEQEESLIDLASRRLCDSHTFILGILANLMVLSKHNQGSTDATTSDLTKQFNGRLTTWFVLTTTARTLTSDESIIRSLTLLRLMLLLAAVDNHERESMLTNIVLYCAVEAGQSSEAVLLDQLVTDMSDWQQHHDGLCDRRLIQSTSNVPYNRLRQTCCWLVSNLKQAVG